MSLSIPIDIQPRHTHILLPSECSAWQSAVFLIYLVRVFVDMPFLEGGRLGIEQ